MNPIERAKKFLAGWNEANGEPKPASSPKNLVERAATVLKSRAYQLHQQEAEAMGEAPMGVEEFERSQKR